MTGNGILLVTVSVFFFKSQFINVAIEFLFCSVASDDNMPTTDEDLYTDLNQIHNRFFHITNNQFMEFSMHNIVMT